MSPTVCSEFPAHPRALFLRLCSKRAFLSFAGAPVITIAILLHELRHFHPVRFPVSLLKSVHLGVIFGSLRGHEPTESSPCIRSLMHPMGTIFGITKIVLFNE